MSAQLCNHPENCTCLVRPMEIAKRIEQIDDFFAQLEDGIGFLNNEAELAAEWRELQAELEKDNWFVLDGWLHTTEPWGPSYKINQTERA
jgi:hypothetical protein